MQTAIEALREIDFSQMLYRGYWVKRNALTCLMHIEKDGQLIHRIPETESWNYARGVIDQLA